MPVYVNNWWEENDPSRPDNPMAVWPDMQSELSVPEPPSLNTPIPAGNPGVSNYYDTFSSQIQKWYQQYLGRVADDAEVRSHYGNPGGLPAVEAVILGSPERKSYLQANPTTTASTGTRTAASMKDAIAKIVAKYPYDNVGFAAALKEIQAQFPDVTSNNKDKITIPGVGTFDIRTGASQGGTGWAWQDVNAAGTASPEDARAPWTGKPDPASGFTYPDWTPPPEFAAPTADTVLGDEGFKARLKMGQDALQRSAAAKGTLLTGGTLKGLQQFSQDYASNEYQSAWDRAYKEYQTKYGNRLTDFGTNYTKDKATYDTAYNIWNAEDTNRFDRLYKLSSLGANTAGSLSIGG